MSYSPDTGYVYIPALDMPYGYGNEPEFTYEEGRWNLANDWRSEYAHVVIRGLMTRWMGCFEGFVSAWDPCCSKRGLADSACRYMERGYVIDSRQLVIPG